MGGLATCAVAGTGGGGPLDDPRRQMPTVAAHDWSLWMVRSVVRPGPRRALHPYFATDPTVV